MSDKRVCECPEILLVRHGHHPDGFRGGWSSHQLTKLGRIQATLLAEHLRQEGSKINTLIASDLPRARETADILGQELGISVSLSKEWREVNNGVLAGMPNDQADAAYPGLYWSSLHMDQEYPGGESPNKFRSRVEGAFRDIRDRILDGSFGHKVLVVTHGGPIRVALSLVDGLGWSNKGPQQPVSEASIHRLAFQENSWRVTRRNDRKHLEDLSVHSLSRSGTPIEVIIRPLVTHDIDKFVRWRATDDYLLNWVNKEIGEHFSGKRTIFVADSPDGIVGTVQFVPIHEDSDLADGKTRGYLQALEVREDYRGIGLGTHLIQAVEQIAGNRMKQVLTLMVEPGNNTALALYYKLGFAVFKESSETWRGKQVPLTCLSKSLSPLPA